MSFTLAADRVTLTGESTQEVLDAYKEQRGNQGYSYVRFENVIRFQNTSIVDAISHLVGNEKQCTCLEIISNKTSIKFVIDDDFFDKVATKLGAGCSLTLVGCILRPLKHIHSLDDGVTDISMINCVVESKVDGEFAQSLIQSIATPYGGSINFSFENCDKLGFADSLLLITCDSAPFSPVTTLVTPFSIKFEFLLEATRDHSSVLIVPECTSFDSQIQADVLTRFSEIQLHVSRIPLSTMKVLLDAMKRDGSRLKKLVFKAETVRVVDDNDNVLEEDDPLVADVIKRYIPSEKYFKFQLGEPSILFEALRDVDTATLQAYVEAQTELGNKVTQLVVIQSDEEEGLDANDEILSLSSSDSDESWLHKPAFKHTPGKPIDLTKGDEEEETAAAAVDTPGEEEDEVNAVNEVNEVNAVDTEAGAVDMEAGDGYISDSFLNEPALKHTPGKPIDRTKGDEEEEATDDETVENIPTDDDKGEEDDEEELPE
jgi:hypothetical protein